MSTYPHSHFFLGSQYSVVVSGPHLQVLETQTGNVVHSTTRLEGVEKEAVLKSGPVRCVAVDTDFRHVVTSGEDKKMKVWDVEGLKLLSTRELPKKPTAIRLTRDGQTILVSDKFGDIFSYPLHANDSHAPSSVEPGTSKRSALTSHENPSDGKLLLGHTSLLTTFLLTEDEKFIISADRDEHIRVSWYPQGYVIERYCLGHRKYVSALHVPSFLPSMLLSGGGDPQIKLWDFMSGELLADIHIQQAVEPYIKVKAPKSSFGRVENDDEGQDKAEKPGRRRGKKGRGKRKEKTEGEDAEKIVVCVEGEAGEVEEGSVKEGEEEAPVDVTLGAPSASGETPKVEALLTVEPEHVVLALQHIDSVDVPEQGHYVVFSAVGATALFCFRFPPLPISQADFPIDALDLGMPVIDFVIGKGGKIWVLVDREHAFESPRLDIADNKRAVRLVQLEDGKLVEVGEAGEAAPLLSALNTTCLLFATVEDLKTLDVYSALISLPKNVDPEHDPMRRGAADNLELDTASNAEEASSRGATPQAGSKRGKAREPTQRELARLKKKRAVMAKIQEQEQVKAAAQRPPAEGEPEPKKAKADDDAVAGGGASERCAIIMEEVA